MSVGAIEAGIDGEFLDTMAEEVFEVVGIGVVSHFAKVHFFFVLLMDFVCGDVGRGVWEGED